MLRKWSLWILLFAVVLGGTACTWNRGRTNIPDFYARVGGIEEGKTTVGEATRLIGSPPNNIIPTGDGGSVLLYTFGDSKTSRFNLLLVNFGKTNVGIDSALLIVDQDSIVQQVNVSTNSQNLNWDFWPFGE